MNAFSLIILYSILLSCNRANPTDPDTGNFKPIPSGAQVLLFEAIADSINTVISELDSDAFGKGRNANEAYNPDLAMHLVRDSQATGGSNAAGSVFKDRYFDDHISVSMITEYDTTALKLLKEWEQRSPAGYTESMYTYGAPIKITYTVEVDGEVASNDYYQPSQFSTGIKLHK